MQGTWYRYWDQNKREIRVNDLNHSESILLFYEMGFNNNISNNINDIRVNNNMTYNNNMNNNMTYKNYKYITNYVINC